MKRITTDNPQTSTEAMLNMARAENGEVMLGFGDEVITLTEYIAKCAKEYGCDVTQESVMDGDNCVECDCPVAILNILGIQAAENNARLKMIEKILGNDYDLDRFKELIEADREGRCVVSPCKLGHEVWIVERDEDEEPECITGYVFLTQIKGYVIVAGFLNGSGNIDEILEDQAGQTLIEYNGDLPVFPACDCYLDKESALKAMKERE